MENDYKRTIEDLTEDEAWLILFLCANQNAAKDVAKKWEDFVSDIMYHKRFSPRSSLLDGIEVMKDNAVFELSKGIVLYRARVFKSSFLDNPTNDSEREKIIQRFNEACPYTTAKNATDIYRILSLDPTITLNQENDDNLYKSIKRILKIDKPWWGYDAQGSDAPPSNLATAGRANPKLISYLYTASDEKTALYEVRPSIGQEVSIATVTIRKNLQIFDMCISEIPETSDFTQVENYFILQKLSSLFSEVNYGSEDEYLPTQFICDYIRDLGFDGIRFRSALNSDGQVVVLFDTNTNSKEQKDNNYEIINSKVYVVKGYDIDYMQIAPMIDE